MPLTAPARRPGPRGASMALLNVSAEEMAPVAAAAAGARVETTRGRAWSATTT
jgi:hypothetical protein